MKTVNRTYINTVSKFTFNTVFSDYKSHNLLPEIVKGLFFICVFYQKGWVDKIPSSYLLLFGSNKEANKLLPLLS